jgi:uncharacterized DUF497 family protein
MLFEWDEHKSRINLRKHGVDFETAVLAFFDSNLLLEKDRIDESGEQRWSALGLAGLQVLMVVHVYRSTEDGEEIIRIVSARKASAAQCRRYSE